MKGMKGKFIKKLKTNIQAIGSLRVQGLVFQVNPSVNNIRTTPVFGEEDHQKEIDGLLYNNNNNSNKHCLKDLIINETTIDHDHGDDHDQEDLSSLSDFEEKCPPGGKDKVVLYTTSLQGIRKTYEDCRAVRSLLESYKVSFSERDVSLDKEFKEELWGVLGGKLVPPRLFIRGRYVGGAEEVVGVLNEQGKLKKLLEGIPISLSGSRCVGCANVRFLVCENCNGSRKVLKDNDDGDSCYTRCPECNENGLVKCSLCR